MQYPSRDDAFLEIVKALANTAAAHNNKVQLSADLDTEPREAPNEYKDCALDELGDYCTAAHERWEELVSDEPDSSPVRFPLSAPLSSQSRRCRAPFPQVPRPRSTHRA